MVANSKDMTFVPGQESGAYALGIVDQPGDLDRLAAYKLKMSKMPVGAEVATKFPWWRKVHETFTASGEKLVLLRPGWQATFENNTDHLVAVEEIRFFIEWGRGASATHQTEMLCKIGIPPRREIIADWTPVYSLHTEIDRTLAADMDTFSYELPAPYVLQRGNQFVMDWRYNATFFTNIAAEDWVVMCGLHGYGLQDGEPISLIKPVRGWPNVAGQANQWQTIAFDDEQGRPMRDAVITHISFGSALTTNVGPNNVLEALEFRPHAPEGPAWHQSEFFAVRDIAEQIGRYGAADHWCIHRPIVPYMLERGEGVLVELWNNAAVTDSVAVDVILRGHQTGRRA